MASMGFSYAQVHVKQERLRRRISEEASAATTMGKSMTGENEKKKQSFTGEEKKADCNTWTAGAGRVHPCASSTAAAAPKGGHW
ncbi:hypothetical protein CFC21_064293 [Triticum aestivum]|uniref:Uncharacterized protein n=2 Tax=Triticum aestivum TaxID=4565 RepID=A0A9R1H2U6_WHEAT|nr:hypothetical protein CFC21_064293 [Triticum aestivum]